MLKYNTLLAVGSAKTSSYLGNAGPIEQVFAKLKHLLRKTAARTVNALHDAIGRLLERFSPNECTHYIVNSGYST
jgi:hypothetical protein